MRYSEYNPPEKYHCSKCPAFGVKLWRQYQTSADSIELLCATCAVTDQKKTGRVSNFGRLRRDDDDDDHVDSDQIGWLVPAIPVETEEKPDTILNRVLSAIKKEATFDYCGYTSVPAEGVVWWSLLPTRQPDNIDLAIDRAAVTIRDQNRSLNDMKRLNLVQFVPAIEKSIVLAETFMKSLLELEPR